MSRALGLYVAGIALLAVAAFLDLGLPWALTVLGFGALIAAIFSVKEQEGE